MSRRGRRGVIYNNFDSLDWGSSGKQQYMYALDVIESGDKRYAFYCGNRESNSIRDDILLRVATRNQGVWRYGPEQLALPHGADEQPGEYIWDRLHACDPDVTAGDFRLNGKRYQYALFYTGIRQDGDPNSIGVAVANQLSGPWFKRNGPLIIGKNQWGAGQPSATSINGGEVLLFYTRGDSDGTRTVRQKIDLSDVQHPAFGSERALTTAGLTTLDGAPAAPLHNGAFAYDGFNDEFWVVREGTPKPSTDPNFISSYVQVAKITGSDIWSGSGRWWVAGNFMLNAHRTHNAGFVTSPWGTAMGANSITMLVTRADRPHNGDFGLWSYRPYETFVRFYKPKPRPRPFTTKSPVPSSDSGITASSVSSGSGQATTAVSTTLDASSKNSALLPTLPLYDLYRRLVIRSPNSLTYLGAFEDIDFDPNAQFAIDSTESAAVGQHMSHHLGVWDSQINVDALTGDPIFTYRVFGETGEIGNAEFYGMEGFCRSSDGARNNLLSRSGVLVTEVIPDIKVECVSLPPTRQQRIIARAPTAVTSGALFGVSRATRHALQQRGYGERVSMLASEALFFVGSICLYYLLEGNGQTATRDETDGVFFYIFLLIGVKVMLGLLSGFCGWLSDKCSEHQFDFPARGLSLAARAVPYGCLLFQATRQDPAELLSSTGLSVATAHVTERVLSGVLSPGSGMG